MSNKEKETKALELVKNYELKRLGISDKSLIRKAEKGSGYDLISADGREIEVKATEQSNFNTGLRLNSEQEIKFVSGGGYVYRVTDCLSSKPKLFIVKGDENHLKVKQWATYCVPTEKQGKAIELDNS